MSTRTRIEWFTGEKLGYHTADELGLGEFVGKDRKVHEYLEYARRKARVRADMLQLYRVYLRTKNPDLWISWHAHVNAIARSKAFRKMGYPNLRKAWAAHRAKAARRRAEKAIQAERDKIARDLERYMQ